MNELLDKTVECPYCGENINVLVDASESDQSYIEDCQVCCRPIVFSVSTDMQGDVSVILRSENE